MSRSHFPGAYDHNSKIPGFEISIPPRIEGQVEERTIDPVSSDGGNPRAFKGVDVGDCDVVVLFEVRGTEVGGTEKFGSEVDVNGVVTNDVLVRL